MISLGHISDLHATPVRVDRVGDFASKRLLGLLSWRVRRGAVHRAEVLDALIDDIRGEAPHHVVVTGDLTNVSTAPEFGAARAWLERLGSPEQISIVPGNHDAYVEVPRDLSWDLWGAYLNSDEGESPGRFPTLRRRGPVAIVGVSSAVPTRPFRATGRVGPEQLERLEKLLFELSNSSLCRVVSIHHPVTPGAVSSRRRLEDAGELRAVLSRTGADLVLHGHGHRTHFDRVAGPRGPIPVVGARSASDVGSRPDKRAQWHLYEIEPTADARRFRIVARVRGWDAQRRRFSHEGEVRLS